MAQPARALFISHGGGPRPLLGDPDHQEMVDCLTELANTLAQPKAIVLVSAHWEASTPTITAATNPPLVYDYYGFPPESYQIPYPAPGAPELATTLQALLTEHQLPATLDHQRGYDHGMFVPLKIMYPKADIPCVQLSLMANLDAELHLRLGEALRSLDPSILVIGSGFSFHNMQAFYAPNQAAVHAKNHAFEQWLIETCSSEHLSESQRRERLVNWEQAPHARFCHPREEHLLPLHVCYGLAGTRAQQVLTPTIFNKESSAYVWY